MNILNGLSEWAVGFFGLDAIIKMIHSGDYSSLRTFDGLLNLVVPLFPLILLVEFLVALLYRRLKLIDYKIPFFSYILNMALGRFISITAIGYCIGHLEPHALMKIGFTWYWFIYGYIVWEFGHFIYHYLGHKVRLFWCLHSTHHAPQTMNLSISFAHFFLEAPYADVIRTSTCILLGVPPPMLFAIMAIDGTWGGLIHLGEQVSKTGRFGALHRFILTPMHHRAHHARNPLYMDTNFCNLLNIWDRVFGTYQVVDPKVPLEYGITRKMRPNSFLDAYFGEFVALGHDVWHAPGIKNKFLYIVMPPGWSHTGEHKTATRVKRLWKEQMTE
ncbi:MAG TPA: sterol desaturase family protein [Puia sp.]|nr:sterol desaturase family protein [Puia sp.]